MIFYLPCEIQKTELSERTALLVQPWLNCTFTLKSCGILVYLFNITLVCFIEVNEIRMIVDQKIKHWPYKCYSRLSNNPQLGIVSILWKNLIISEDDAAGKNAYFYINAAPRPSWKHLQLKRTYSLSHFFVQMLSPAKLSLILFPATQMFRFLIWHVLRKKMSKVYPRIMRILWFVTKKQKQKQKLYPTLLKRKEFIYSCT